MEKVLFAQIIKVDVAKRQVTGRATQEVTDRANEIFDYATSKPLFEAWSNGIAAATKAAGQEVSLGNIRAMHGKVAAGKVVELTFNDEEKAIDVVTEIVDDAEWLKVEKGLYTGFSIGGNYHKKWKAAADNGATRFTADPVEISIVDLPCVPTATFSMIKGDGLAEDVAFVKIDPAEGSETAEPSDAPAVVGAQADAPADAPVVDVAAEVDVPPVVAEVVTETPVESPAVLAARQALADAIAADEAARVAAEQAAADAAKAASAPLAKTTVEKGMYSVGQFADVLQTIAWMAQDAEWEKGWEQDASSIPEELRAWLALGTEIFKKMSAEETAELIAALVPPESTPMALAAGGDLGKAGARHSKADLAKVQGIHDHAVSLGASCETEKAAPSPMEKLSGGELSDLGKAVALATGAAPTSAVIEPEQITALAKFALDLSAENTALKQAPAAPKGVARVVGKADDASELEKQAPAAIAPNPADPKAVMKAVHATGGRRVM